MRNEISVSVVIPTYNRREIISQAVDSVLCQSIQPTEVIIVDDGSSDGTVDFLERHYGSRIIVIQQPNRGVSAARNKGILAAKGELLAFLDSDDRWLPRKLELQLPTMVDKRIVLSFSSIAVEPVGAAWFKNLRSHESKLIASPFSELCRENRPWIHVGACIMRRDAVLRAGMFDERMRIAEDTLLIYRLAFEGFFAAMSEVLYEWNLSEKRTAPLTLPDDDHYLKTQNAASVEILMETYARANDLDIHENILVRKKLATLMANQASYFARGGSYTAARRKAIEALGFGVSGRSALQAVAALLCPKTFARVLEKRKCKKSFLKFLIF